MKHFKLFVALFAMLALNVGNAWGAEESVVYTETFEDSAYKTSTTYNNSTENKHGPTNTQWGVLCGTPNTGAHNGSKAFAMRYYKSVSKTPTLTQYFDINNVDAISFWSKTESTNNKLNVEYSTDGGSSWSSLASNISITTSYKEYSYNFSTQQAKVRLRFTMGTTTEKKSMFIDDIEFISTSSTGSGTEETAPSLTEEQFSWSAAAATATLPDKFDEKPTLTNTEDLAVSYSTSNDKVATIDASGNVTLVGVGTADIKATAGGEGTTFKETTVYYTLTVKPAPLVIEPIEGGIIDILTHETFGVKTTSYTSFSGKQATNDNHSDAVYAGKTARNGNNTQYNIQLNQLKDGRQFATTTSGGLAKRVYVKWATKTENTNARALNIYGSNTAYTGTETSTSTTKIGTITFTTGAAEAYVDLEGDYKYILITGSGAIYMDEIQVTWVAGETPEVPTIDAPTFSLAAGKYNEEQEVTLSAEEGTIYYTLDGTTPTADSEEYTAPIVLDECGEITIKAIAISGETTSSVASATYTIKLPLNNSQANPYTEAEAIEVYNGGCYDDQMVYVKGVVANAQFYSSSNTYTITLKDGFLFYYFYEDAGDTQFTEDYIETGDTLIACGKLSVHSSKYQLAKGCYLVERKPYSVPKVDISNTPETAYTVAEAIALIDNVTSDLTKQVYVKGEISKIDSYNATYGSITYWIKDEEGNTFQCYSGLGLNSEKFESVDDLVVASQVVVCGTLNKHNSTYEFNYNNYIVSLTLPSYTVTVSANLAEAGTVTSGGSFEHGAEATFTATANEGYVFVKWTVDGEEVSKDAEYTFEVLEDCNLVANFDYIYETVCFINTKEWDEVWVYVWNEYGNNGWPGKKLEPISTFYGYDVYGVAYPLVAEITNVIFNNGQDGEDNKKTDDLVWTPNNFYMIDGWYTADELNNLPFTVTGSSTSLFGSEWDPTNTTNDMVKQADGTTYRLVKENVTLAAGNIEYKVAVNHSWAWFTYPEEGNVNLNIPVSGRYNVTFTLDLETAEVTATAELLEEIVVLPAIAVKGAWDGWAKTTPFVLADDNATASVVITISTVGDYDFGINVDGQFTANGAHVTRDANDVAGLEGNSGNMLLSVDEAGDYTFTWTYATKTLVITFPTVEPEVPTALDNIDSTVAPVKAIVNGQLIIIKNGVQYNAQGAVVK